MLHLYTGKHAQYSNAHNNIHLFAFVVSVCLLVCSPAHEMVHGLGEGARRRGKPKRTWLTDITTCTREAEDWQTWRRIATSLKGNKGCDCSVQS